MAIYGDMLIYFSDLFIDVHYFKQIARVGSGYDPNGAKVIKSVIFQSINGSEIAGPVGRLAKRSGWGNLALGDTQTIWSQERLTEGDYVQVVNSKRIYRLLSQLDWGNEAGFFVYGIEKVIGDNGNKNEELPIYEGEF